MTMTADRIQAISPAVPESAFDLGYHAMTAAEMSQHQRTHFASLPRFPFSGLRPGQRYAIADGYRKGAVWYVHKVSPSGSQVTASSPAHGPIRLFAGSYRGDTFALLDDLMASFVGVTHRAVVAEAVSRGLAVPAQVRREYPELFVEVPDRFAKAHESAAERLRSALAPNWSRETTARTVRGWVEAAHQELARYSDLKTRLLAHDPGAAGDYRRMEADALGNLEFYRWLLPLVSPGGVFHVD